MPPSRQSYARSFLQRSWKWIASLASLLVLLSGLLTYFPLLTVDPGTPLDPNDFTSYPFSITNDSPLPLFGVYATCVLYDAKSIGDFHINNMGTNTRGEKVTLWPHQKTTPPCFSGIRLHMSIKKGTEIVTVYYHVFLWPFPVSTSRSFMAVLNSDGHTVFLAQ
jgi:hypothetical protein